jgi:uncharacterized SAM-binding protein YcdF (DUF218 family)
MHDIYPIIKQVLMPPSLILVLLLAGFLLSLAGKRLPGKLLLAVGIVLYYGLSTGPTADRLLRPLECRYQPLAPERLPELGTLVVLGGGAARTPCAPSSARLTRESSSRIVHAVQLYHRMDKPRIIVVGDGGEPFPRVSEAELMRDLLIALGVPPDYVRSEGGSGSTFENARAVQRLRLQRPLILVTSARQMPRAMSVFAALDMEPLAAPCDFHQSDAVDDPRRFLPSARSLVDSTGAVYEYLGTWWYELTGIVSRTPKPEDEPRQMKAAARKASVPDLSRLPMAGGGSCAT